MSDMGRLRYGVATTLDGYIASSDGSADWIVEDASIDFDALFAEHDAFVMGRKTYEVMLSFGGPNHLAGRPKQSVVVVSRELDQAENPHITIVSGDGDGDTCLDAIRALKASVKGDIWLMGGGQLAGPCLEAGLVDTVEAAIMPVVLGQGIKMLATSGRAYKLQLRHLEHLGGSGIILTKYDVSPDSRLQGPCQLVEAPTHRDPAAPKASKKRALADADANATAGAPAPKKSKAATSKATASKATASKATASKTPKETPAVKSERATAIPRLMLGPNGEPTPPRVVPAEAAPSLQKLMIPPFWILGIDASPEREMTLGCREWWGHYMNWLDKNKTALKMKAASWKRRDWDFVCLHPVVEDDEDEDDEDEEEEEEEEEERLDDGAAAQGASDQAKDKHKHDHSLVG
ncbi:riboflavin biosynthesis protein RibD domain-containing protein [Purpureocillium lavendulum]|uniref:2,5-diamino-6-ribosylamino-4(3H)-pyrimidinone 5'-phosphate reductase n=1 Tax=Purpureocillium lavendulum TaxID=1247861 RepID=A0AB34FSQ6_9HYPO|nr:riboflavin biosynthesis protein RibD domain-containing protein [Purpureocillium lavendulum]